MQLQLVLLFFILCLFILSSSQTQVEHDQNDISSLEALLPTRKNVQNKILQHNERGETPSLHEKIRSKYRKNGKVNGLGKYSADHKEKEEPITHHQRVVSHHPKEILPLRPAVQDTTPLSTLKAGPHPPSSRTKVDVHPKTPGSKLDNSLIDRFNYLLEANANSQEVLYKRQMSLKQKYEEIFENGYEPRSRIPGVDPPIVVSPISGFSGICHLLASPHELPNCPISCEYRTIGSDPAAHVCLIYYGGHPQLQPHQKVGAITLEADFKHSPAASEYVDILSTYSRYSEIFINYFEAVHLNDTEFKTNDFTRVFGLGDHYDRLRKQYWKDHKNEVLASTMISNCGGDPRQSYISILNELVPIDHYGACSYGKPSLRGVGRGSDMLGDYKISVLNKYKFSLVFENSLLDDYVTEKYFQGLMAYNSIPIYLGAPNIEDYLPVDAKKYKGKVVINALDYPNPEDLAEYMWYLSKNDTAFDEYFQWRRDGQILEEFKERRKHDLWHWEEWVCETCKHYNKYYDPAE